MTVGFQYLEDMSSTEVRVFSAVLNDDTLTEFDKFDSKEFLNRDAELEYLYSILHVFIEEGYDPDLLRKEDAADAIAVLYADIDEIRFRDDNSDPNDQGIRLYCFARPGVLVLFNGDIKTAQNPRECLNVSTYFDIAVKVSRKLERDISQRVINISDENPFSHTEYEI